MIKRTVLVGFAIVIVILTGCSCDTTSTAAKPQSTSDVGVVATATIPQKETSHPATEPQEDDVIEIDIETLLGAAWEWNDGKPDQFEALVGKKLRITGKVVLAAGVHSAMIYLQPVKRMSSYGWGAVLANTVPSSSRDLVNIAMALKKGDIVTMMGVLQEKEEKYLILEFPDTVCAITILELNNN